MMQKRSIRGRIGGSGTAGSERPASATTAAPTVRSGAAARGGGGGVRGSHPSRMAALRRPASHASLGASRIDRNSAPSPVESVASTTTVGTKRKERDYEVEVEVETNINVIVRCRARNEREQRENSAVVVSTEGVKGKLVELSMGPSSVSNKTYNFDRVFSPAADQAMLYDDVVKPILEEMLSGFNCTIFAYGQTGTGKTYTMSGDMNEQFGLLSDAAGIIPRVLRSLFNKLETEETESFVKVSFIELYNEELRDLNSQEEHAKLKIFDDTSRKGHATTIVQGMEESHIKTAADGIKLLQNGSLKRQVAATKCNDLSSRSHTVFTITACIKRTGEDGEDYISAGKLNLVDLAGSENIQRSGAENKRAAEAGLINKSLLTLGRVINALVDHGSHIPYRESKLTRLLQDSLGGRTKTCIIATISPAKSNLEETISTLDYAFRAKNIRNKPQVNQMINKKTLLRDFTNEIERLKSELIATRQRNGVYLSNDNYEEMTAQSESRRIQNEEQAAKIETLESNLRNKVEELWSLTSNFMGLKKEHETVKVQLEEKQSLLDKTELVLAATRKTLKEETCMRKAHEQTEDKMRAIGGHLIETLHKTVQDVDGLHAKNKRKSDLQSLNRSTWEMAQGRVSDVTWLVERRVEELKVKQERHMATISERMQCFAQEELHKITSTRDHLDSDLQLWDHSKTELAEQKEKSKQEMDKVLEDINHARDQIKRGFNQSLDFLMGKIHETTSDVLGELDFLYGQLSASYTSLGKDFKSIFESLVQHMTSQKEESDRLRRQVQDASAIMAQSNAAIAERIQQVVAAERRQAAEERKKLLVQITNLVNSQAETEDSRLAHKAASIQQSVLQNNETFEGSLALYGQSMDCWQETEGKLLGQVTTAQETIRTKLEKDLTTAGRHYVFFQDSVKTMRDETRCIGEEGLTDMDSKMLSLDHHVTQARSRNAAHHDQHGVSLQSLSDTVQDSYEKIHSHVKESTSRVESLASAMDLVTADIRADLGPLGDRVCQPLGDLRQDINETVLQDYQPTGDTPPRTLYQYPTHLPQTEAHTKLLQELYKASSPSGPSSTSTRPLPSDADGSPTGSRSTSPLPCSDFLSPQPVRNGDSPILPSSTSLTSEARLSSATSAIPAPTTTAPPAHNHALSPLRVVVAESDNTLPQAKRSRTTRFSSKAAATAAATKPSSTTASVEGRENVPPIPVVGGAPRAGEMFAQVVSRRKSPRLH